jgi:uncharacterized membrane protein YraQ (UPF0718 family)
MSSDGRFTGWRKAATYLVVGCVLAGVFMAYLNPHTVVDLANRVWSCFG